HGKAHVLYCAASGSARWRADRMVHTRSKKFRLGHRERKHSEDKSSYGKSNKQGSESLLFWHDIELLRIEIESRASRSRASPGDDRRSTDVTATFADER